MFMVNASLTDVNQKYGSHSGWSAALACQPQEPARHAGNNHGKSKHDGDHKGVHFADTGIGQGRDHGPFAHPPSSDGYG